MKTIRILKSVITIVLSGVIFSINTYARNPSNDYPEHAKQVKQILEKSVKFPGCSINRVHHGVAIVVFTISDKGIIQIEGISANCKALEANLREQLTGLYFKGVVPPGDQHYRVKFTFLFC
jgi:hypothetical protein